MTTHLPQQLLHLFSFPSLERLLIRLDGLLPILLLLPITRRVSRRRLAVELAILNVRFQLLTIRDSFNVLRRLGRLWSLFISRFRRYASDSINAPVLRLKKPLGECNEKTTSKYLRSYRFVKTFVVKYEILVLLPGRHKVIRNSVEHLAIDLSLRWVKGISVIVDSESSTNLHYEQRTPSKPSSKTRRKSGPRIHVGRPLEWESAGSKSLN